MPKMYLLIGVRLISIFLARVLSCALTKLQILRTHYNRLKIVVDVASPNLSQGGEVCVTRRNINGSSLIATSPRTQK